MKTTPTATLWERVHGEQVEDCKNTFTEYNGLVATLAACESAKAAALEAQGAAADAVNTFPMSDYSKRREARVRELQLLDAAGEEPAWVRQTLQPLLDEARTLRPEAVVVPPALDVHREGNMSDNRVVGMIVNNGDPEQRTEKVRVSTEPYVVARAKALRELADSARRGLVHGRLANRAAFEAFVAAELKNVPTIPRLPALLERFGAPGRALAARLTAAA